MDVADDLRVQILKAEPGDVVCLSSPAPLDPARAVKIIDDVRSILPVGVRAMILDNGLQVAGVLRPGEPTMDLLEKTRV